MDSTQAMNAIGHHPKLTANILLRRGATPAGSKLEALLEVDAKAEWQLGLGNMIVELIAQEQLISKSTTLRAIFLQDLNRFQGKDLPPSNICHPIQDPRSPLPKGYWPSKEGKCSFPISFLLPSDVPSSLTLPNKLARVTYTLRSSISLCYQGTSSVLINSREVSVVGLLDEHEGEESWGGTGEEWMGPNDIMWEGKVGNWAGGGAGGKVKVEVGVGERCLVAGRKEVVWMKVGNWSSRKISSPTLAIIRRLLLPSPVSEDPDSSQPRTLELVVSDTVLTAPFRGNQFEFLPQTETVVPLEITIPEELRSLRAGKRDDGRGRKRDALFEVRCVVEIKIGTGVLGKDIHLELPVFVAHPASLPPAFLDRPPPLHPTIAPPSSTPFHPWIQAHSMRSPESHNYPPPAFHPSQQQQRVSSAMSFHAPRTPLPPPLVSPSAWSIISGQALSSPLALASPTSTYSPPWDQRAASVAPHSVWGVQPYGATSSRPPSSMGYASQQQQQWAPHARPSSAMDAYHPGGGGWQGYAPPFSSQAAPPSSFPHQQPPPSPQRSSTTPAPYDYHNHPSPFIPPPVLSPRAERISHHLRESSSSRGRSVSPPRSNLVSLLDQAASNPNPWQQPQPPARSPSIRRIPVDSNLLRRVEHTTPPRSSPSPAPGSYGQRQPPRQPLPPGFVPYPSSGHSSSPREILSPKAVGLAELKGYFDPIGESGESTAGTMKSVADLERMVEEQEQQPLSVVDGNIVGPTTETSASDFNKTLPPPPVPSVRTKPSPFAAVVSGGSGPKEEEGVKPVKPSLLEAFEKAAEEKERRKERRKEEEVTRLGMGGRRNSVDVRMTGGREDASKVPRSTTLPELASPSKARTAFSSPSAQIPVTSLNPTSIAGDSKPSLSIALPSPSFSTSTKPSTPLQPTPRTPTTTQASLASPTLSPKPTTTGLAPTKSALAEIERLKGVKASRVGAWLGGAVLSRGRGDDSEGTIKGNQRNEIVPVEDVPATGVTRKSGEGKAVASVGPLVLVKPASLNPPPVANSLTTPVFSTLPLHAPPILQPSATDEPSSSEPEIIIPARFASRLKKSQFGGIGREDAEAEQKKYDGKSARGGKGGKVADVTKIWATNFTESTPKSTTTPPPPKPKPVASQPSSSRPSPSLSLSSSTLSTTPARNPVKSLSAPVFLNTTTAGIKPSLSSAASLVSSSSSSAALKSSSAQTGKPKAEIGKGKVKGGGSEGGREAKVIGTLDKSFSKQKLRELREKYGG